MILPQLDIPPAIDPVLVAIIRNRLEAIAEEMAQTLMMTSRSGIFAEARDFVTGICDAQGRLVAQSRYFPGFACALPYLFPAVLGKFQGKLDDGDVIIVNDPYQGNSHLPDMNILKPVFAEGRLAFWAVCKGHMADIGGGGVAGYDPTAETVWDEGLIIPPSKLYVRGALQEDFLGLVLKQLKLPEIVRGDILCEVGGAEIGARGIAGLLGKYSLATVEAHVNAFLDVSEKAMRARILAMPEGVYRAEKAIDDDVASDRPLTVRVTVTVKGSEVTFDFSESDGQSPRYMNSTDAFTRSMAALTLFATLEHAESNDGALRPISFVNPPGLCTNAAFPASTVVATCSMAECVQEAVQLALSQAVPDKVAAPSAKIVFPLIAYIDPDAQRLNVNVDFFFRCNPSGGTKGFDGWEQGGPAQEMGMGRCPDPEIHEMVAPVRIQRFEQEIDSAGAGAFRGGNGHVYRVKHLVPSVAATVFGSGTKPHAAPSGICGGRDPAPSVFAIERAAEDGKRDIIRLNSFFEVAAGDIIELRAMGAAGYGDPLTRDPERVARDVRDGYVSAAAARETYGVVLDEAGAVDEHATRIVRAEHIEP
jgi:N-methylhydantoinase B